MPSSQIADIIEDAQISQTYVILKFKLTPRAVALTVSNFRLLHADGTSPGDPVSETSYGFKPINLLADYESISRRLKLYFAQSIEPGDYFLEVNTFTDANGQEHVDDTLHFPFTYNFTPIDPQSSDPEAGRPPVQVRDFSIKGFTLVSGNQGSVNEDFQVVSYDPDNHSYYLDPDYKNGLITVNFSSRPSLQYVNETYIKVQKKELATPGRWETVDVQITLDSTKPRVYIYLPDTENGQYNVDDLEYLEDNHKYRVRISKDLVGTVSA